MFFCDTITDGIFYVLRAYSKDIMLEKKL